MILNSVNIVRVVGLCSLFLTFNPLFSVVVGKLGVYVHTVTLQLTYKVSRHIFIGSYKLSFLDAGGYGVYNELVR